MCANDQIIFRGVFWLVISIVYMITKFDNVCNLTFDQALTLSYQTCLAGYTRFMLGKTSNDMPTGGITQVLVCT